MSKVIGLNCVTVDVILNELAEARAAGKLTHIMVVTLDEDLCLHSAISQMANERAVWMADHMLRIAREKQA